MHALRPLRVPRYFQSMFATFSVYIGRAICCANCVSQAVGQVKVCSSKGLVTCTKAAINCKYFACGLAHYAHVHALCFMCMNIWQRKKPRSTHATDLSLNAWHMQVAVGSAGAALDMQRKGARQRQKAATALNYHSSRSHSIFMVH